MDNPSSGSSEKPVLLVSSGIIHPPLRASWQVASVVRSVTQSLDIRRIRRTLPNIGWRSYRLVILYTHVQRAHAHAIESLRDYVHSGGALLALHSATASFKGNRDFEDLMGAAFSNHDAYGTMRCNPVDPWASAAVSEPFEISEELYRHHERAQRHILLTADTGEPIVWTRAFGKGRVMYLVFGHGRSAYQQPETRAIFVHALRTLLFPDEQGVVGGNPV